MPAAQLQAISRQPALYAGYPSRFAAWSRRPHCARQGKARNAQGHALASGEASRLARRRPIRL